MISPAFLDELARFESGIDQQTTSIQQGEQQSQSVGEGLTFSDYRRYSRGDDTRLIDWRLYARTGEYYIKQFEEERNLTVHILLDASASMDFGEELQDKFEFGAKLGLGYAYLTAEAHDEFRFSLFTNSYDRIDTGASTRGEVLTLIDQLNEYTPSGEAEFATAFETYAGSINSRSLVVIVTDCLGDLSELETGLSSLAENEVILAQVLAPGEINPDISGDTIFKGTETAIQRRTYFGGSRAKQYQSAVDQFVDNVNSRAQELAVQHNMLPTDSDFFESFTDIWIG